MTIRFALLGDIELRLEGRAAELGHARQRCVLAALLVDANQAVPVDRLGERVWGEQPPRRFRTTLYSYLSRLRRILQAADASGTAARINREPGGYRLSVDASAVDLHLFRGLVARARAERDDKAADALYGRALELWRGEPFATADTPWFNSLREVLVRERLSAQLERNDVALRLGEHTRLLAGLYGAADAYPLDERLAGQLMLALYRCGRTADALGHYEHTRARLADELGIDPGPPLRQLRQRILTAHPDLDLSPGLNAGPLAVPVPRQLPAPPAAFTGRLPELERLDRTLAGRTAVSTDRTTGGTVVISAIGGLAGIGKTWLALCWAHRNADRFPDGQLYVDLRGFDPSSPPVAPAAAVRQFLEALGVGRDAIPVDTEAASALYRSVLADKTALVVLDDARDAQHVRPLLPGSASCTVLVTSRDRLTSLVATHGADLLHLDVIGDADARALLVRRLGERRVAAEPEAVAALIAYCGGLPLALGIAAARAVSHPDFPLGVLADELGAAAHRLDALDVEGRTAADLRAVFAASQQALSAPARRLFGLLGIAPGPDIGTDAAASVAGLPPATAWRFLAELEEAHLVEQWRPGRYRMHDLVRLYAAEAGGAAPDRAAALTRVTDFYLHTAFAANRLLDGPDTPFRPAPAPPVEGAAPREPADAAAALEWFAAEHACLLAAQATAFEERRYPVVWQLAWALISFHLSGHHLEEYEEVWRRALCAAEDHSGEPGPRALAHWRSGHARALRGEHTEALDHLELALALVERDGDTAGQAHVTRTVAWVWEQKEDCPRALDHATRALALYAAVGNTAWLANQLNAVGWLSARLGRYEEAQAHCEQALALFRRGDRPDDAASTLDSLGYIAHRRGRWASAVAHYEQALALFAASGGTYDQADTLANLAETLDAMGYGDRARTVRLQALDLYRAQNRAACVERMRRLTGSGDL
ncbi:BTAD domain-containing putative transcriptional regulator [Streptomyces sp. NPDC057654]|uniref:AfsR/SARP family transcriptional regulator n=1 Tax=Streptomyces sp. NPDC057654 TaxID=3346196 RepID=UPI0036C83ADB